MHLLMPPEGNNPSSHWTSTHRLHQVAPLQTSCIYMVSNAPGQFAVIAWPLRLAGHHQMSQSGLAGSRHEGTATMEGTHNTAAQPQLDQTCETFAQTDVPFEAALVRAVGIQASMAKTCDSAAQAGDFGPSTSCREAATQARQQSSWAGSNQAQQTDPPWLQRPEESRAINKPVVSSSVHD